jgi:two-component system, OmpR family, sensor kinase ParS
VFSLFVRIYLGMALAASVALLVSRFFLETPESEINLQLLRGHAEMHARTIGSAPPPQRRDVAASLEEQLGVPLRLEPARGIATTRSEWRGGRMFIIARVPDSEGQVALGPLPPGGVVALPSSLLAGLVIALIIAAVAAVPPSRTIRELETTAEQMCSGDFAARIERREGGFLDRLGGKLNQLGERIGHLVADERDLLRTVAHEVRAPIARMRFRVECIERNVSESDSKYTKGLVGDLAQVDNLFGELLTYVAFDEFDRDRPPLDIIQFNVLERTQEVVNEVTATSDTTTDVLGAKDAQIWANQKLFDRALTNLLLNAMAYGGPQLRVEVRNHPKVCVIDVQDSGPGIPPEHRLEVIKPFVRKTTKRANGTGLGLAIVFRIMRLHQGSLHIVDAPRGGASIQLVWKKEPAGSSLRVAPPAKNRGTA